MDNIKKKERNIRVYVYLYIYLYVYLELAYILFIWNLKKKYNIKYLYIIFHFIAHTISSLQPETMQNQISCLTEISILHDTITHWRDFNPWVYTYILPKKSKFFKLWNLGNYC